jgi:hypothetical protein
MCQQKTQKKQGIQVGAKTKNRKAVTRPQAKACSRKGVTRSKLTKPAREEAKREASYTKGVLTQPTPVFFPCVLLGPDGKERPGWEMHVGDMMFGRADSKETLLAYYTRIHEPLPSGHWRERTWQPQPKRTRGRRPRGEREEYRDNKEEVELEDEPGESWEA